MQQMQGAFAATGESFCFWLWYLPWNFSSLSSESGQWTAIVQGLRELRLEDDQPKRGSTIEMEIRIAGIARLNASIILFNQCR